jgi:hypothetical protein
MTMKDISLFFANAAITVYLRTTRGWFERQTMTPLLVKNKIQPFVALVIPAQAGIHDLAVGG